MPAGNTGTLAGPSALTAQRPGGSQTLQVPSTYWFGEAAFFAWLGQFTLWKLYHNAVRKGETLCRVFLVKSKMFPQSGAWNWEGKLRLHTLGLTLQASEQEQDLVTKMPR